MNRKVMRCAEKKKRCMTYLNEFAQIGHVISRKENFESAKIESEQKTETGHENAENTLI